MTNTPPAAPLDRDAEDMAEPQNYEHSLQPHENGVNRDPQFSPPPVQAETQTRLVVLRQQKEYRMRLAGLVLRGAGAVFSFLSFVIMASNDHDRSGLNFDDFEEYRYSLAIAVIAFVYLAVQLGRGIYDTVLGHNLFPKIVFCYIDFIGDQVLAYLLMSASSSAASLTNRLREGGDTKFTDMAAASVSMSFMAFALLAASSVFSGHALTKRIRW